MNNATRAQGMHTLKLIEDQELDLEQTNTLNLFLPALAGGVKNGSLPELEIFRAVCEGRADPKSLEPKGEGLKTGRVQSLLALPKHLYEFRICKEGTDATALVEQTRRTFFVSEYAETMTKADKFVVGPKEEVIIRVFTCESLGVAGWVETEFFGPKGFEHVKNFGLLPCISDDAFPIRAAHPNQKLDEWIRLAHPPISADGCSGVFGVGHDRAGGRYVHGCGLSSGDRLRPGDLVALRVASPSP